MQILAAVLGPFRLFIQILHLLCCIDEHATSLRPMHRTVSVCGNRVSPRKLRALLQTAATQHPHMKNLLCALIHTIAAMYQAKLFQRSNLSSQVPLGN